MATAYTQALSRYTGNGVTTQWSVGFPYTKTDEVKVYLKVGDLAQVTLEENVDYSFINESTILFPKSGSEYSVLTDADVLAIQRESTFESNYVFDNQQRLYPAEVMNADDMEMRHLQELKRDIDRSIKLTPTSRVDVDELLDQVERVYESIDNIDTNANNIGSINTNATNIDDINTNADNINDIKTNAENISDINNVSLNITKINTAAEDLDLGDDSNIKIVAEDLSGPVSTQFIKKVGENIDHVIVNSQHKDQIDTNAANIASINITAGIATDVSKVANIDDKVSAVADNETNVNTVATNMTAVNNTSTHIQEIIDAPTYANNANIWAEGTDEQVQAIGGQHSAKGWADIASEGADKDLGNLTPIGENHFTNKNMSNLTEEGRLFVGTKGYSIDNTFNTDEVVVSVVGGKLLFYKSLADNNTGHALSDTAYWKEIIIGGINGMAGIEPSIATNLRVEENGTSVILKWNDPADTYNKNGQLICAWKGTRIVKKLGEYPVDENDGETVVEITERDKYAINGYTDTEGTGYYYKAFPYSAHGVFCRHDRNCFGVYLFGYVWDTMQADPATAIQYPENVDNTNYRAAYMNKTLLKFQWGDWLNAPFLPKPCALKRSGTVDYYLNENDYTLKAEGGISDVANSNYDGNFMMEWDTVYRKKFKKDNYIYCYFSNKKLDNDYECWSTKKADGTYADHFYTAIYQGTSVNNCLRSYSSAGRCWGTTGGAANERTQASANGTGWDIRTASDSDLIIDLYILMFKHLDSQKQLGFCTTAASALTLNCGEGNQKGMFYGVDGGPLKFFGMENWYSHRWEREVGLINRNGTYYIKHTKSAIDGSTTSSYNLDGTGYKNTGLSVPVASGSYIYDENVYDGSFLPRTVGGSATTYTCDGMWSNNGQINVLYRGGSVNNGSVVGVLCFNVPDLASYSSWGLGVSLSYHLE